MKRLFWMFFLLSLTAFAAFSQSVSLDEAIKTCGEEISDRFEESAKIAVLNFSSSSEAMSAYVIDELNTVLVNDGRLTVLSRRDLDLIREEIDFNDSGEVSNQSAQQIGRMLGAQFIVNGSLGIVGGNYRFVGQVLEVETAAIKYSKTLNIANDTVVKSLMSGGGVVDFSRNERIRAGALNLVFGTGSFIQRDTRGGAITAVLEGLGVGAFILGIAGYSSEKGQYGYEYEYTLLDSNFSIPLFAGIGLYAGGAV
ncbi:MAG: CsgG/HfaB family protein, partial [Treponema sp.]|nr:CsgG/HfaB family protein [Treponema sp.]